MRLNVELEAGGEEEEEEMADPPLNKVQHIPPLRCLLSHRTMQTVSKMLNYLKTLDHDLRVGSCQVATLVSL